MPLQSYLKTSNNYCNLSFLKNLRAITHSLDQEPAGYMANLENYNSKTKII